jgi:hypothetical protein
VRGRGAEAGRARARAGAVRTPTSFPSRPPLDSLHVCEFCLKYFAKRSTLLRHASRCDLRHPPGDEIYRSPPPGPPGRDGGPHADAVASPTVAVFEVDGKKDKVWGRRRGGERDQTRTPTQPQPQRHPHPQPSPLRSTASRSACSPNSSSTTRRSTTTSTPSCFTSCAKRTRTGKAEKNRLF